jgi:hypothetical protein
VRRIFVVSGFFFPSSFSRFLCAAGRAGGPVDARERI